MTQRRGQMMNAEKQPAVAGPFLSEGLGARWIEWSGGRCPLEAGSRCETRHRDGSVTKNRRVYASDRWEHLGTPCDIVAYRVTG